MLYLEEDWTDIPVTGSTLLWKNEENATWIVYRPCSEKNTRNEMQKERERDWKSALVVYFSMTMISDQIKPRWPKHLIGNCTHPTGKDDWTF